MMTGVIVQATMTKNGAALVEIGNKPLIGHIFARLGDKIKSVVSTTVDPADDVIEEYCEVNEIDYFRGSPENVFERFYLTAVEYCFSDVVALQGDCPFPDVEEIGRLLELHTSTGADYSHSFGLLPAGVGAEAYTFETLRKIARKAKRPNHFATVNGYIIDKPQLFKVSVLEVAEAKRAPELSLVVDSEDALQKARLIEEKAGGEVTTEKAIEICSSLA